MTETFPPELQRFVQQELASGTYGSERELVLEAVRFLCDSKSRFAKLRADVKARLDRLDRGEGIELEGDQALAAFLDEIEAEVHAELAAEQKKSE